MTDDGQTPTGEPEVPGVPEVPGEPDTAGEPGVSGAPGRPDAPGETGVSESTESRLRELLQSGAGVAPATDGLAAVYSVRHKVHTRRLEGGVAGLLVAGLVAGLVIVPGHGRSPAPVPIATGDHPRTYRLTGTLTSFGGCSDYLSYMKTQAAAQVGPYGLQPYDQQGIYHGLASGAGSMTPEAAPSISNGAATFGASGTSAAAGTATGGGTAGSYSQTNDQVAGVDEPDTVKTNGTSVVTLDGSTLRVLDQSAHVLGHISLSGDTGGGFLLDGNQAIVFSSQDTASSYGVVTPAFGAASGAGVSYPGAYLPHGQPPAQAVVVDLSNPAAPVLVRTFQFDGTVVAARLVGQQVRLALDTSGPRIGFQTPAADGDTASATAANKALIAASTLDEWLPSYQVENPDGSMSAHTPVSSCQSVSRPAHASGLATVSVLTLDPASATPGPGTSVVAAGQTVYATADRFYVAGPTATSNTTQPQAGYQQGCCTVVPPAGATTSIYAFDTPTTGPPLFVGSGQVPGWLINSYAMDEDATGLLRVASTAAGLTNPDPRVGPLPGGDAPSAGANVVPSEGTVSTSQSLITVFRVSGGALTQIGQIGGLGVGEFVRAVRFIGADAYVVTYRTFDPLYVVNLADPTHPTLAGQLDQPGFSEFLYPLPGNRLLGVGVNLTDNEPSGLVVATYDVSNPAHPTRIATSDLADGAQFAYSGYDPHAFLYWAPLNLALLAAPNSNNESASGVSAFQIGPSGGLTRTATLTHASDAATRSVVINGQLWVITTGGVITSELTNLPASTWHGY
ncbi:MAG TPA: beta-propeller domain-containing protein [Acidimicrobiales bacterium]|jgi:hypothetical protein|nr:beta-propeller domain-containing protein [Acidimicrobiales bacterium]